MKASDLPAVRALYDDSAAWYSQMMDQEIQHPRYAQLLSELAARVGPLAGSVIDTSCGSGHMLEMYGKRFDANRQLLGLDLSPIMVTLARQRLGPETAVEQADMRKLESVAPNSAAGLISFFALHHLGPTELQPTLERWHSKLVPGGQLLLATWEGSGAIDYGGSTDIVAFKFTSQQIREACVSAQFRVEQCSVETIEEMGMDAVYLAASR